MCRFLAGLGFGAIGGGLAYLFTHGSLAWGIGVGLTIAIGVWVREFIDLLPD